MNYQKVAKEQEPYIISMRRYFHENPELSGREENTIAVIESELTKMGVSYVVIPNGGILAKIQGSYDNGRAVMLRADIDALPIQETDRNLKSLRICKSKTPGVMHACGHDGHTAMLLGAAKILSGIRDEIQGTVYLCFERGEEHTGNIRYIIAYIEKEGISIDSAYGIHLMATLESGKLGINDRDMMAGPMVFDVSIEGKAGHGSRPDQAVNPIDAFHMIYGGLQSLRVSRINPYQTLTYSIGSLHAGSAHNVIPQTLSFSGSMRTFDRDGAGMEFYREFRELIDGSCKLCHCVPTYHKYTLPSIPVINDAQCAQLARAAIADALGEGSVGTTEPWMASDSFSLYQLLWPGVYAFLGVQNLDKGIGAEHHNCYFDIDESVLYKGSASAVAYAIAFLKSGIDTSKRKSPGGYRAFLKKMEKYDVLEELYGE